MYSTYRVKADELTDTFLQALRTAYGDREIEIIVRDVEDETEYLLRSEANRNHLLQAIDNLKNGADVVTVSFDSSDE